MDATPDRLSFRHVEVHFRVEFRIYINRAEAFKDQGAYDCAIQDYSKIIQIKPNFYIAYFYRSRSYFHRGQFDLAVQDYSKMIQLKPNDASAKNDLAWILSSCPKTSCRDGKRAVELAREAVRLKRSSRHVSTLAAAYAESGDFEEAKKMQRQAIDLLKDQTASQKTISDFANRLESYRNHKAWRFKSNGR